MVCGFLFDCTGKSVVLILKNRPAWQAGKFNGVGGHIEEGETPRQAMSREFAEETRLKIPEPEWWPVLDLSGEDWRVHFFCAFNDGAYFTKTHEDEEVSLHSPFNLPKNCIPNLRWIIPLCLDRDVLVGEDRLQITLESQEEERQWEKS